MRYLLIIILFSSCRLSSTNNPPTPTNVLFILADDLGINALGCYGNEYVETPNIDRLSREGMRFSNGYSADPTCAPSRGSIMTGQYVPRHGIYRVSDRYEQDSITLAAMRYLPPANHRPEGKGVGLDPTEITLAEAFKAGGYATAGFGKWHLGQGASAMGRQGFDQAVETTKHYGFKAEPAQTDILVNEYNADYTTRKGIAFMKEMKAAGKPFFLYMPYYLVHKPLEPKPGILAYFKKKHGDKLSMETLQVLAMIKSLDESVGQLLAALEELGVVENTLVAFVSDNGHYKTNDAIFNRPYRGNKGETLEGGIRVPYIFRMPGRIPAATKNAAPILHIDLYPTLLDMAGIDRPTEQVLDGESLVPLLEGQRVDTKREALIWQYTNYAGYNAKWGNFRSSWVNVIQSEGYKLTEDVETGKYTLFNLKTDPYEEREIAASNPEIIARLTARLASWKQHTGAETPRNNSEYSGKD
ncbi:sulfatase [Neolewinella persica]|uniref:sulfatase n=1 Tax=Neolewinella persica TaxID=70998 RepID=UPI0005C6DDB4|nr:sulfatase [Neolewinella persica]